MSVPWKRIQVVKVLKDRFKEIRQSNYYNTDIGNNVYEWRVVPFSSDQLPAINIRDIEAISIDNASVGAFGLTNWKVTLLIDVITTGDNAVYQLREAMSDVYKCIGKDVDVNDIVLDIRIIRDSINVVSQENYRRATGTIELEVLLRTQTWSD